eukprot:RCo010532
MNVLSSVGTLKKKVVPDKDTEKEDLIRQVKELKEKVAQLEQDNDALVSENLSLQEQLEEEKKRTVDLTQARVDDKRAQMAALQEEQQTIASQRELLKMLSGEIRRLSPGGAPPTAASQ